MSLLESIKGISTAKENKFDIIMGFPGSGKTSLAGTYPKPLLHVQIGDDGGGIVLSDYKDDEVKQILLENDSTSTIYTKLMALLDELGKSNGAGFKTIVLDAYSSLEESMIQTATAAKGRALSWDERGAISQAMINLRDKIVLLSKNTPSRYVAITHLKTTDSTDNVSGESTTRYIPKMSAGNGNIMLERANNVMYCARKVCKGADDKNEVKFLTYIGAHPNIDTKFRYKSQLLNDKKGIYIENCTYDDIVALQENKKINKVVNETVSDDNNPFKEEVKEW